MSNLLYIFKVCYQRSKLGLFLLVILSFFSAFIELIGFGIIIPIINLSISDSVGTDKFSVYIQKTIKSLGFEPELTILLVILCILFFLKGFLIFIIDVSKIVITTNLKKKVQVNIVNLINSAHFLYHLKNKSGDRLNLISREVDRFVTTFSNLALMIISAISILLFMGSLIVIETKIIIFMILIIILFYFIFKPIFSISKKYSFESTKLSSNLQNSLIQLIHNFSYLKGTNRTSKLITLIKSSVFNLIKITRLMNYLATMLTVIKEPIGVLILSFLIYYKVILNGENISEALFIGIIMYRSVQRVLDFQNGWHRMNEACGGLYFVEKGIKDLEKNKEKDLGTEQPNLTKDLKFKNITLKYSSNIILDNISFTIKPMEILGIMGPSGSGKSSIINLITKLVSPSKGEIYLGETNFKKINNHFLRDKIGYVTQDPSIVQGTLRENISFFDKNNDKYSNKYLRDCMKSAGIENLYSRIKESMYEAGKNYSGGQKQRITIAREIYRNPDILIFDEPTSSLDRKSTRIIENTILQFKNKKTIIIISHNLEFLSSCDKVIILKTGKISYNGSYKKLKNNYKSYL